MSYEKSHRPRKPVMKERECLKCEKIVELEDDMRICSSCTTANNNNSSAVGSIEASMSGSPSGKRAARS